MLTIITVRNHLLLPEARIAPEIVKGDKDALRLVKSTAMGPLGGAIGPPSTDRDRPARRVSRLASPLREDITRMGERANLHAVSRLTGRY